MRFFDSNVVVYGYDSSDARKNAIAQQLLAEAPLKKDVVVSTQVFGEFFNAAVTKRKIMTAAEVLFVIQKLSAGMIVADVDLGLVRNAVAIHQRYQLRYLDSLIIATAKRMQCSEVLSEDMSDGQNYDGVTVRNPFKA